MRKKTSSKFIIFIYGNTTKEDENLTKELTKT